MVMGQSGKEPSDIRVQENRMRFIYLNDVFTTLAAIYEFFVVTSKSSSQSIGGEENFKTNPNLFNAN